MANLAFVTGRPHGRGTRCDRTAGTGCGPPATMYAIISMPGERMIHVHAIDTLAQRLAALVPPGLHEARADLTANFRSALQAGLRDLDLVTREEFDVQRCVLLRTREKIEELEQQVLALERSIAANAAPRH